MPKDSKDGGSNPFEEWVSGEGSSKIDKLDKGIEGTQPYTQTSTDDLPASTPDWVIKTIEAGNKDPNRIQIAFLEMELDARLEKGTLLMPGESPEKWIDAAEKLRPDDRLKNWNLRLAAEEYLVDASQGDTDAANRAKVLLKAVLGGDGVLAEEIFPRLIERIESFNSSR